MCLERKNPRKLYGLEIGAKEVIILSSKVWKGKCIDHKHA